MMSRGILLESKMVNEIVVQQMIIETIWFTLVTKRNLLPIFWTKKSIFAMRVPKGTYFEPVTTVTTVTIDTSITTVITVITATIKLSYTIKPFYQFH